MWVSSAPSENPDGSSVELVGCGITSISEANLQPASSINLARNHIRILDGIPFPDIVTQLNLSDNRIEEISEEAIKQLKALVSLNISGNKIGKIHGLFYPPHLQNLNLSRNRIVTLENLEGVTSLKSLDVSENSLRQIIMRSPLPRLASLDISKNPIRTLHGLSAFPCLATLNMSNCALRSPSGIQSLLNLRRFIGDHNGIENFAPFFHPLLGEMSLNSNRISSLTPFVCFQSLATLNLAHNPIDDTAFVGNMRFLQLKELILDFTEITNLDAISQMAPNITLLSVRGCNLVSMDSILACVETLPYLIELETRENPINAHLYPDKEGQFESDEEYDRANMESLDDRHAYRQSILAKALQSLEILDGIRVTRNQPIKLEDVEPIYVPLIAEEEEEEEEEDENDDLDFDRFSAMTDMDNDLFRSTNNHELHEYSAPQKKSKSFWISIDPVPSRRRPKSTRPSYSEPPLVPTRQKTNNGHYPFNTKSERRLPWNKQPETPPPWPQEVKLRQYPARTPR